MDIQGISSSRYVAYLDAAKSNSNAVIPVRGRNLGPDTVFISEAAYHKLDVAKGLAEPELNEMGKLIASRLDAVLAAGEDLENAPSRSQLMPGNYARLQLIEAEIQQGNDSQKLQDEKLLLILFGDTREFTDQDLAEGRELLDTLMPSRDASLSFTDLVKALRKSIGLANGETGGSEEAAEEMSPEMRLMMEKLKEFLEDSKGASISISLQADWKETTVTLGPDEKGEQRISVDIEGTIAPAG